jgi:hypothetical protein
MFKFKTVVGKRKIENLRKDLRTKASNSDEFASVIKHQQQGWVRPKIGEETNMNSKIRSNVK